MPRTNLILFQLLVGLLVGMLLIYLSTGPVQFMMILCSGTVSFRINSKLNSGLHTIDQSMLQDGLQVVIGFIYIIPLAIWVYNNLLQLTA